ncbi:Cation/H(+) antiporter 3 [Linum perenne]
MAGTTESLQKPFHPQQQTAAAPQFPVMPKPFGGSHDNSPAIISPPRWIPPFVVLNFNFFFPVSPAIIFSGSMSKVASTQIWVNESVCFAIPPRLFAGGFMFTDDLGVPPLENLLSGSLPLLTMQMLVIFLVHNALHFILRRFGIISFVSQCLAGVILGATILGKDQYYRSLLFPHNSQDTLGAVATLGYSLFMFLTGVKMDVGMMLRSGRKIMIIGIASVLVPYAIGLAVQYHRLIYAQGLLERMETIGSTAIQSMTTFQVVSHLLVELKMTNSELGRLALSSSLVSSLVASSLELGATIVTEKRGGMNALQTLASALFAAFVLRPGMKWVIRRTPEGHKVHSACVPILISVALAYQIFFDSMKQSQALGPFILGLAVPPGPPLGSTLVDSLETVTNSQLFPLFVVTAVMRGDLYSVFRNDFRNKKYYISSMLASLVVKFTICLVLTLPWMPRSDSSVLALIMSSKGIYDLGVYTIHRDSMATGESMFSLCVFCIMLNATFIPMIIKYLYDPSRKYGGYQARNLFSLKQNSELRILPCIHKPDHIISVTNILDISCPTEDNPIGVYAIHLVELVGRTTPVFLSHQKQKAVSDSCSINVILALNQYERGKFGLTTVETFTSISQPKFMPEDICTLALDKTTSLILLPFHITWTIDGSIETEDNSLRMVNCKVLERAPCSVCIFFNRGNLIINRAFDYTAAATYLYSVCMIYMGGSDDHEALCLAARMAKDSNLHLTVLHLNYRQDEDASTNRRNRLSTMLKEALKEISEFPNVQYIERPVEDGPQTALAIRTIVNDYDMFVVGRRNGLESPQTSGLGEWSEFPELGIIGDLLASQDLETKASVLVVQQQKQFKK